MCADNDEAPRVVDSVVDGFVVVDGAVGVVTSLSVVCVTVELPVVVVFSGSHAKAIFVIASSNFWTPASFCFSKFSFERFIIFWTISAGRFWFSDKYLINWKKKSLWKLAEDKWKLQGCFLTKLKSFCSLTFAAIASTIGTKKLKTKMKNLVNFH